jgi:pyruvate dehydrogenase E1 component
MLLASTNPACVAYDPAWGFELAVIVKDALRRMYGDDAENVFYYLTLYNEPYQQPAAPDGVEEGILRGLYLYAAAPTPDAATGRAKRNGDRPHAQVLASGIAVRLALQAQQLLADDWGVAADVWSATSWNELRRDAVAAEEWNLLHPDDAPRTPYVTTALADRPGPVVAVSDWMRAVPDQISCWVPGEFSSLGTDGFGRSDTRAALRRHFHIDAESITVAVLAALAERGEVKSESVGEAIARYELFDERAAGGSTEAQQPDTAS